MAKVSVNKLVSLILEEIKDTSAPIFFSDFQDVVNYFDVDDNPESKNGQEEVGEMAYTDREQRMEKVETLDEPIRIPAQNLINGGNKPIPKIVSKDPVTGEFVEDVVVANVLITLPNGGQIVKFHNYGEKVGLDRKDMGTHYVKVPENIHFPNWPRSKKYGTEYKRSDKAKILPGDDPKTIEKKVKRQESENEAYAKRYVIFPAINKVFTTPEILNRLDMCLVPEVRAGILRTERTTNEEKRMIFGGNRPTINAEFHSVMDRATLDESINYIFDVRAAVEDRTQRERILSTFKPREYGGYRYPGGYWDAMQRIYNEADFEAAGKYTPILKLFKKNIQEGQKGMNIISKLLIEGDRVENEYVLRAKFWTILNYRTSEEGGPLKSRSFTPDIFAEVRKPIPEDVDPEDLTLRNNKDFFGKPASPDNPDSGIFSELMDQIGRKILETLDPDDSIDKITQLVVPNALDVNFLQ